MIKRNPKNVLVDYEEKMPLDQAISFLETIVNKLKTEGSFSLTQGEQSHLVKPSSQVVLEVKLEERNDNHTFELELEWVEGEEGKSQGLIIE